MMAGEVVEARLVQDPVELPAVNSCYIPPEGRLTVKDLIIVGHRTHGRMSVIVEIAASAQRHIQNAEIARLITDLVEDGGRRREFFQENGRVPVFQRGQA